MGWHVITPFCLEGCERDGDTILVNRGWVQNQFLNPSTREEGQIEETHELVGAIRKTEQRQQFAAKHLGGNKWQYRYCSALSYRFDRLLHRKHITGNFNELDRRITPYRLLIEMFFKQGYSSSSLTTWNKAYIS